METPEDFEKWLRKQGVPAHFSELADEFRVYWKDVLVGVSAEGQFTKYICHNRTSHRQLWSGMDISEGDAKEMFREAFGAAGIDIEWASGLLIFTSADSFKVQAQWYEAELSFVVLRF